MRDQMVDKQGGVVHVKVNGDKVWVNYGPKCAFRCYATDHLIIEVNGKTMFERGGVDDGSGR